MCLIVVVVLWTFLMLMVAWDQFVMQYVIGNSLYLVGFARLGSSTSQTCVEIKQ